MSWKDQRCGSRNGVEVAIDLLVINGAICKKHMEKPKVEPTLVILLNSPLCVSVSVLIYLHIHLCMYICIYI